jgi:protein-tyrosine phosphatase
MGAGRLILPLIVGVFLAPTSFTTAQTFNRWVPLHYAHYNFRDIGDYEAGTTATVATGRVFRSAQLADITDADADIIRLRGIILIIDLRITDELLANGLDYWGLDAFASHAYIEVAYVGSAPQSYVNMIQNNGPEWRDVFRLLADRRNLPLDYHCQMGKDRAGVLTGLILTFLGVPRETVIQDYLLSNVAYGQTVVYRSWLEAALDEVNARGGIENYLTSSGVSQSVKQAVRANLLVPKPITAARHWHLYR